MKDRIRYSMAFKLKVMEELRDGKWKSVSGAATAYGISYNTVYVWMRALGFEHLKGRLIYVKTRTEIDEIKRLKEELRRLKIQLSDEILDHKIDEAALQIACSKLGITPEELKKRAPKNSAYDLLKDKKKSIRHLQEARHDKAVVL